MKLSKVNRRNTSFFTQQQLDFCYNTDVFSQFITEPISIDAFFNQIQRKKKAFSPAQRKVLRDRLLEKTFSDNVKYCGYVSQENEGLLRSNIESLTNENTFTVVTGHQMVAMTGPLYVIYKIAHVIRLCELLKNTYPDYNFVPVFWLASEDHDYQEVRSFNLFNRSFSWDTQQSGPVGRFRMENWEQVLVEFSELFKNHPESEIFELISAFEGDNYADAYMRLIGRLFGKYGLVMINADDNVFKRQFIPYMEREINEHFSYKAITKTTEKLLQIGGREQITPREINLFYINNTVRERLIERGDQIEIPTQGIYSKEEVLKWIRNKPEDFSPNVSLRPLYQEVLLPNICYVGGAGEINYWLQLKGVFDIANIPFPLLQTRNSFVWIDQNTSEKLNKLNLSPADIFKELHVLQREYMESFAGEEIDFNNIDEQFHKLQQVMLNNTLEIDPSLESYAVAESVRMEKQVQHFKDKLYKTVKSKHDKNLKIIQQIKDKLFPNNQLQERYTNFFQLAPDGNYSNVLRQIVECTEPLTNDIIIVEATDQYSNN